MAGLFSDDAVHTDGPRGTYRGIDAIRAELTAMGQIDMRFLEERVTAALASTG
jgi:hypothetical protein